MPSTAGPEDGAGSSAAFQLGPNARIDSLTVEGDVAGRDIVKITEDLTYDVSDLSANPYRGLASYLYDSRAFYAGRERQVADALARLTAPGDEYALTFVTGASGSGKSSFAQAGLIPALEAWYADHNRTTRWTVARPGRHPLAALGRALASLGVPEPSADGADWPTLLRAPEGFSTLLATHTPAHQINLLVLDQFEELFTQAEPAERDSVCALLSSLGAFDTLHTHVLVTLRSDYLPAVFNTPPLFALVKQGGIELRAMAADELARAIRQPLLEQARRDQKNKRVDPALVKRLVEDGGQDPTLLPLVQVTLTALWDEPPHRLTLERYASLTDALQRQADRAYELDRLSRPRSEAERRTVLHIFLDLVEVSLDDDPHRDVRRTVPKRDLVGDEPERARLIDELVDARLLATTLEQRGDTSIDSIDLVDIIHESLLRNWPRLRDAITAAREMLQSRERLRLAVHDWVEHDRSDEYLLVGVRLAEAQQLAATHDILTRDADAVALLRGSTVRQEEERQRELEQARALAEEHQARAEDSLRSAHRLRIWLGVALLLAVLALVGAGGAVIGFRRAADQADANRSRELAAEAQVQVASDGDLGILLAEAALGVADTTEAESALREVLVRSPARRVIRLPDSGVTTAHFSPGGDSLLTGGRDGSLRLWDPGSGALLAEFGRQPSPIVSATFSPDGARAATVTNDGVVRTWDTKTRGMLAERRAPDVGLLAFSPDSRRLAVGAANGNAQVFNTETLGAGVDLLGHSGAVLALSFSADGRRLVTASADQTARVWSLDTAQPPLELRGHTAFVSDAAFDPNGERVVTASADGSARIWDARSGAVQMELRGHDGAVRSATFSPDGARVLTAGADGTARVWDTAPGDQRNTVLVLVGHKQAIQRASFGPGGRQIVTASSDQTARVWDSHTGELVAELRGHSRDVTSAEFSPDGQQVLTTSAIDGTARLWQVDSGEEWLGLVGHAGKAYAAAFAPDGRSVASGGADSTVRLWPLVGQSDLITRTLDGPVGSLEYSPDGRTLVVGLIGGGGSILDASGQSGAPQVRLAGHSGFLYAATFSPDGTRVLTTGADRVARIWSVADGRLVGELVGHTGDVTGAAFSPDGHRIATASFDGSVRIWDAATLQSLFELRGHVGEVYRVRYMPDGRNLVTAGADGSVRVWDAESGRELSRRSMHVGAVYALAISADGRTALSGGADRSVLVWDTSGDWRVMGQLTGATQDVLSVGFSADGQRAVTSSADGLVRVYRREWFAPIQEVRALAPSRVMRQPATLLPEERVKYLHEGIPSATAVY